MKLQRSRGARPALASAVAAVVAGLSMVAEADEAARARFHFERGLHLYRQGQLEGAVREFIAVRSLSDSPEPLYNLAVCFEQLRAPDRAYFYYRAYQQAGIDQLGSNPEHLSRTEAAILRLEGQVAVLRLESEPAGAAVYVGRREHGSYGATPVEVPVAPGRHRVWFERDGYRGAETELVARRGENTSHRAELLRVVGRVEVASVPHGDVLLLDDEGATAARGASPLAVAVPPGVYVAELQAPGHRAAKAVLRVVEAETTEQVVTLEPLPPPTGTLIVTSNRPGALVSVDGFPVGFAPAVLRDLPLGPRSVRIEHPPDQPWAGDVEVQPERPGYLTATLEPPPTRERWPGTWVLAGLGGSALVAGGVTGILALDAQQRFEDRRRNPDGRPIDDLRAQGLTLAGATNGLIAAGAAAALTAVILYFVTEVEGAQVSRAAVSW